MKRRIVLDTNMIISATRKHSLARHAFKLADDQFNIVHSEQTLGELIEKATTPKIIRAFGSENLRSMIEYLAQRTEFVESTFVLDPIQADPKDTKFVELALSAGATMILSRDRHLTDLKQVISPLKPTIDIMHYDQFIRFQGMRNSIRWHAQLAAQHAH